MADTADTGEPADTGPPTDADGDGYWTPEDCDDTDPAIHPGARDDWDGEGVDSDCNGKGAWSSLGGGHGRSFQVVPDVDGDGRMEFLSTYWWPDDGTCYVAYLESPFSSSDSEDWLQVWGYSIDVWPPEDLFVGSGSPVGDLDGDGLLEFVFACGDTETDWAVVDTSLCLFDGTTLNAAWPDYPQPMAVLDEMPGLLEPVRLLGDLDGDGTGELAVGHTPARVFSTATLLDADFALEAAPVAVDLEFELDEPGSLDDVSLAINFGIEQADVDGDGLAELFTGNRFYWGADLAEPGAYTAAEASHAASLLGVIGCTGGNAGDLSGDGRADLFVLCQEDGDHGTVRFAEYDAGSGAPAFLVGQVVGGEVYEVGPVVGTLGDADGDGCGDLVVGTLEPATRSPGKDARFTDGWFLVPGALLKGTVALDDTQRYLDGGSSDVALADLDADGFSDLLVGGGYASGLLYHELLP